jgi:hypothetical protein
LTEDSIILLALQLKIISSVAVNTNKYSNHRWTWPNYITIMNGCYYSFMLNERSYCYTRNSLHSKSSCVKLLPWYIPSKFTKLNQTCTKWQEQTLSIQWKETQRSFAFSRNKIRYSLLCLIQKCMMCFFGMSAALGAGLRGALHRRRHSPTTTTLVPARSCLPPANSLGIYGCEVRWPRLCWSCICPSRCLQLVVAQPCCSESRHLAIHGWRLG